MQAGIPLSGRSALLKDQYGETVIEALTTAHTIRDRYTILGDGMNEAAAREVARATGVIEG